jgi:glycosyltransferase involved in cell wall biosynthesis
MLSSACATEFVHNDAEEMPKVLAVVPVYNGHRFVSKAIKSLLLQKYPGLKIVVIDDCSEDDSTSLVASQVSDSARVTVVRNEQNIGLAQTLNKALELVTDEEFLLVLEQDCELLNENYVVEAFRHLDCNKDVAVVSGENLLSDTRKMSLMKRIFVHHLCEDVHDQDVVEVGFSLLKADLLRVDVLKRVGGFESSSKWKLASEEHLVSYKIRSQGYKIIKDPCLKFAGYWDGQEKLGENLRKEAAYGRGLGWAFAAMKSDLEVGKSKQLRSKKISRAVETQYVLLTVLSLFLFLHDMLIPLALLSLATLLQLGYLCYRAWSLTDVRKRLLFITTGFLRAWVYVPNFCLGTLYGLASKLKGA